MLLNKTKTGNLILFLLASIVNILRRYQSDEEIMYEKIDLSNSALTRKEKARLMKMLIKYRDVFSLRDEIGECPNLEADIKVIDESPFFVRPFPLSESHKPFMDK